MLIGFLRCGNFIIHALLLGTSKALSVFLLGARVYILLLGTQQYDY